MQSVSYFRRAQVGSRAKCSAFEKQSVRLLVNYEGSCFRLHSNSSTPAVSVTAQHTAGPSGCLWCVTVKTTSPAVDIIAALHQLGRKFFKLQKLEKEIFDFCS